MKDTYDSEESCPLKNTSMTANERNSSSRFERPDLRSLAVYTACCALIYPFLYVITLICNGRSLFEVRLYVGLGCTVVSTIIGIFLLKFAKRFIEASSTSPLYPYYFAISLTSCISTRRPSLGNVATAESCPATCSNNTAGALRIGIWSDQPALSSTCATYPKTFARFYGREWRDRPVCNAMCSHE